MPKKVAVNISKKLVDKIQRHVDESGGEFKTVEEYIEFVLTELLREDEQEQPYTPRRRRSRRGYEDQGYIL